VALRVEESDLGSRQELAKGGMARVYDLADFRIGEQSHLPLAGLRPSPTSGVVGGLRSRVTPGSVLPVR
jgi:hypothetical protein